jgi:hypothetical protein
MRFAPSHQRSGRPCGHGAAVKLPTDGTWSRLGCHDIDLRFLHGIFESKFALNSVKRPRHAFENRDFATRRQLFRNIIAHRFRTDRLHSLRWPGFCAGTVRRYFDLIQLHRSFVNSSWTAVPGSQQTNVRSGRTVVFYLRCAE